EVLNSQIDAILNRPEKEPLVYIEMADAHAEPKEEEKIYNGDADGLRKAAKEVVEAREPEIVERSYTTFGGEDHGKPRPDNETISIDRAVTDLTRIRNQEQDAEQATADRRLAIDADANRLGISLTPDQISEVIQLQDQQAAQPEAQPQQ